MTGTATAPVPTTSCAELLLRSGSTLTVLTLAEASTSPASTTTTSIWQLVEAPLANVATLQLTVLPVSVAPQVLEMKLILLDSSSVKVRPAAVPGPLLVPMTL